MTQESDHPAPPGIQQGSPGPSGATDVQHAPGLLSWGTGRVYEKIIGSPKAMTPVSKDSEWTEATFLGEKLLRN